MNGKNLDPQEKKWLLQGIMDEILGTTRLCRVYNDLNVEGGFYVVFQWGGEFSTTELETIDYMVKPLDLERTTTVDGRFRRSINLAPRKEADQSTHFKRLLGI